LSGGLNPGSSHPPTIAHDSIARAAVEAHGLDRLDIVVSRIALAKEHVARPELEHRIEVLRAWADSHGKLSVVVTDAQLLVDIAAGYDLPVVGADKWHQIHDLAFYDGSAAARDAAVAALPPVAIVPRPPHQVPRHLLLDVDAPGGDTPGHDVAGTGVAGVDVLRVDGPVDDVSSTAARAGQIELMVDAAAAFDRRTGAWTDPERYDRWRSPGS
jgi:hypothetical protein